MPNIHSSISFGLVNIPVILNPVIKNNDIAFNQLHNKCLHRIKYIKYCPYCKKEVKESNIVKGYMYEKNNYIVFSKEELSNLKLDKMQEIEVIGFIKESEIDPWYYEKSYFLSYEGKNKAYDLFYEALKKTKKVALAKTILSSKFYYCILRLAKSGIIMNTLYYKEEINIPDEKKDKDVSNQELALAIKLIDGMTTSFEPSKYKDEYQKNIEDAINKKLSGKKIGKKKSTSKKQINDLMEALESSLKDIT